MKPREKTAKGRVTWGAQCLRVGKILGSMTVRNNSGRFPSFPSRTHVEWLPGEKPAQTLHGGAAAEGTVWCGPLRQNMHRGGEWCRTWAGVFS